MPLPPASIEFFQSSFICRSSKAVVRRRRRLQDSVASAPALCDEGIICRWSTLARVYRIWNNLLRKFRARFLMPLAARPGEICGPVY
jgi:hypothetical protein